MDEARFGQQGTLTRTWAPAGTRPTAVKQTKYEWIYLYAAVEPATGNSTALLAPSVNTGTMNVFLRMLSEDVGPDDVAFVIMDRAGWHVSRSLRVPRNIWLILLPPYSPRRGSSERSTRTRPHRRGRVRRPASGGRGCDRRRAWLSGGSSAGRADRIS